MTIETDLQEARARIGELEKERDDARQLLDNEHKWHLQTDAIRARLEDENNAYRARIQELEKPVADIAKQPLTSEHGEDGDYEDAYDTIVNMCRAVIVSPVRQKATEKT